MGEEGTTHDLGALKEERGLRVGRTETREERDTTLVGTNLRRHNK